jgi:hypothetical protein
VRKAASGCLRASRAVVVNTHSPKDSFSPSTVGRCAADSDWYRRAARVRLVAVIQFGQRQRNPLSAPAVWRVSPTPPPFARRPRPDVTDSWSPAAAGITRAPVSLAMVLRADYADGQSWVSCVCSVACWGSLPCWGCWSSPSGQRCGSFCCPCDTCPWSDAVIATTAGLQCSRKPIRRGFQMPSLIDDRLRCGSLRNELSPWVR